MIRKFLSVMLLCLPLWACAEEAHVTEYKEGVNYAAVIPPLSGGDGDKVQVVELFLYSCPHCFRLEPHIHQWLESKPADVEFSRIPAIFNARDKQKQVIRDENGNPLPDPTLELLARAYYTADVMGVLDKIHTPLFDAIHVERQRPYNKEALRAIFIAQGVDGNDFDATFNSFAVNGLVANAFKKTKQYAISGVPTLAVGGKYRVDAGMVETFGEMLNVTNFLVARERAANPLVSKEAEAK